MILKLRTVYDNLDWFDKLKPISIIPYLKPEIANKFRRKNIKGFVNIGGCNFYIGLEHQEYLIGVLGFQSPEMGTYDIMIKADTTPSAYENSTDLLLYVLRSKEVKDALEYKFNRQIKTAYSMCFSQHQQINRYRKHAELITKKIIKENKVSATEEEKIKDLLTFAFEKGFKTAGQSIGIFMDIIDNHREEIKR